AGGYGGDGGAAGATGAPGVGGAAGGAGGGAAAGAAGGGGGGAGTAGAAGGDAGGVEWRGFGSIRVGGSGAGGDPPSTTSSSSGPWVACPSRTARAAPTGSWVTRRPSWKVPFALPRSRTTQPVCSQMISRCRR